MLPVDRLERAGATPEEVQHLQQQHTGTIKRLETLAEQDIREWLQELRDAGHFSETVEDPAVKEVTDLLNGKTA
jgi:hypothetical protein